MDNILQAFKIQLIVERIANQTLMIIQKLLIIHAIMEMVYLKNLVTFLKKSFYFSGIPSHKLSLQKLKVFGIFFAMIMTFN